MTSLSCRVAVGPPPDKTSLVVGRTVGCGMNVIAFDLEGVGSGRAGGPCLGGQLHLQTIDERRVVDGLDGVAVFGHANAPR